MLLFHLHKIILCNQFFIMRNAITLCVHGGDKSQSNFAKWRRIFVSYIHIHVHIHVHAHNVDKDTLKKEKEAIFSYN